MLTFKQLCDGIAEKTDQNVTDVRRITSCFFRDYTTNDYLDVKHGTDFDGEVEEYDKTDPKPKEDK